jgi:protease-4
MSFERESIFVSAIRSLCNSLGAVLGICIAVFLAIIALGSLSEPEMVPPKSEFTIAPDAEGNRRLLSLTAPVILRINLQGVIGLEKLTSEHFQGILYDSTEGLLKNGRVKAIFLNVDTPGGAATDSASIYQALVDYKQKYNIPVYAFVDGMCASGGMYICAAADKIYASSGSVIGSVGVLLGPNFNFSELMTKVGISSLTLTQGKDKDALNPFRPWRPEEDSSLVTITKELYEQFVDAVVSGRPRLNKDKLVNEYGAHVFLAKTAEDLGYIDVSGANYSSAMKECATAASLKDGEYQVIELSSPESIFSQLTQNKFGLFSGKVEHSFSTSPYSALSGKMLYLYQPQ